MADERQSFIVVDNFEGKTCLYTGATMEDICELICRNAGIKDLHDASDAVISWMSGEEVEPFANWQAVYEFFQENSDAVQYEFNTDQYEFNADAVTCVHIEDATPMPIQEALKGYRESQE